MREPERDYGRLQDIIQAANNILSFTEGHTQEQLSSDKLRYFAVVKNVEIMSGEHSKTKRKDEPFLDYCCDVRIFVRHSNIAL